MKAGMIVHTLLAAVWLLVQPWGASAAGTTAYSAADLYNAANAYARQGKHGLAVLDYQRARLLDPGDADIIANLQYVRSAAHLDAPAPPAIERAFTWIDPANAGRLGLAGILLLGAGLTVPRPRSLRIASIALGGVLVGVPVGQAAVLWPIVHGGVVIKAGTVARVSPAPIADQSFVLPEAETVRIAALRPDFVLVQTRDGRRGWIARDSIAPVVPDPPASTL